MKAFILVAAATISLGMAGVGHAQTTSASTGTAAATAIIMNSTPAGLAAGAALGSGAGQTGAAGAAVANSNIGSLANPQWVMGQTASPPGMVTYDACQLSRSGGAGPISAGWTQTIDDCYAQRQAQMAKDMGMMPMAYEIMCQVPRWQQADVNTSTNACSQARRAAAQKGQPVSAIPTPASQGIVVSSVGGVPAGCRLNQPGNYITC